MREGFGLGAGPRIDGLRPVVKKRSELIQVFVGDWEGGAVSLGEIEV